jgi:hypothetical protein
MLIRCKVGVDYCVLTKATSPAWDRSGLDPSPSLAVVVPVQVHGVPTAWLTVLSCCSVSKECGQYNLHLPSGFFSLLLRLCYRIISYSVLW